MKRKSDYQQQLTAYVRSLKSNRKCFVNEKNFHAKQAILTQQVIVDIDRQIYTTEQQLKNEIRSNR